MAAPAGVVVPTMPQRAVLSPKHHTCSAAFAIAGEEGKHIHVYVSSDYSNLWAVGLLAD